MANETLAQESSKIFGTATTEAGLVQYDPDSFSRAASMPKTQDITGNIDPIGLIKSRDTRTYTPPQVSKGGGGDEYEAPYISNINIVAPTLNDTGKLTNQKEFQNLSNEQLKALGLLGMTPTSLEKSFYNLSRMEDYDVFSSLTNATFQGTGIKSAWDLGTKALNGTFENLFSKAQTMDPIAASKLILAANQFANINLDDPLGKAAQNIEDIFTGMADFINDPIGTLDSFLSMAGTYNEYGTYAPEINNFNVNGVEETFISDKNGNVVTTPGFTQSLLKGPMIMAPAMDVLLGFFTGTSVQEHAQAKMDNYNLASNLPSIDVDLAGVHGIDAQTGSVTSLADLAASGSTAFVSVDIPGHGKTNIDLAAFDKDGIKSAVSSNIDFYDRPELENTLENFINANRSAIDSKASEVGEAANALVDFAFTDLGISQTTGGTFVDSNATHIDLVNAVVNALVDSNISPQPKAPAPNDKLIAISKIPHIANMIQKVQRDRLIRHPEEVISTQENIFSLGGYEGQGYNSPDPSWNALDLAEKSMAITGKNTWNPEFNEEDRRAAFSIKGLLDEGSNEAGPGTGVAGPDIAGDVEGYDPATGRPTAEQQAINDAAWDAQLEAWDAEGADPSGKSGFDMGDMSW